MYRDRWVIFLAAGYTKQYYFVCPVILLSYWKAYEAAHQVKDARDIDTLLAWVETVPPTLRRKIIKYEGIFLNPKDVPDHKLRTASTIVTDAPLGINNFFDPDTWIRNLMKNVSKN
jgi:hypothetical protein